MTIQHPWARSIVFEGVTLPATMIAIDHLGKAPEISEATSLWLWRFTTCVGVVNHDSAENVMRHASEALNLVISSRGRLLEIIASRFDGRFDGQVLDEWETGLRTIFEVARSQIHCSWTALD